jgi:hypothetical protein
VVAVRYGQGADLAGQVMWVRPFGAYYALGLDGMALLMVLMTLVIVPSCCWPSGARARINGRWQSSTYVALVLALESLALYVFLATDVLFYHFEATLTRCTSHRRLGRRQAGRGGGQVPAVLARRHCDAVQRRGRGVLRRRPDRRAICSPT